MAVVYALDAHTQQTGQPANDQVAKVLETGPWSVASFWRENFPGLDLQVHLFLPAVTINPDRSKSPGHKGGLPRERLLDSAAGAAQNRGLQRDLYQHLFVVVHGGEGFDFGGYGSDAVVFTSTDLSTMCHEFGHCLGFHHSHGFVSNRIGDGTLADAYGSNYDVMAVPSGRTLPDPADPNIPPHRLIGAATIGPMLARASLHHYKPDALRNHGMVREMDLTDKIVTEDVWAAGRGQGGRPELLAFYIDGARGDPHRQLLVEYRQPDPTGSGPSRWDAGIDGEPWEGNAPGVVVYRVKLAMQANGQPEYNHPYYAGTVSVEGSDYDVEVTYPGSQHTSYTVALREQGEVRDVRPDHVRVMAGPTHLFPPTLRISADVDVTREGTRTELRPLPPWMPKLWGPQPYELTSTRTRWTLAARTHGLGGTSNLTEPESSWIRWVVDGESVPDDGTQIALRNGDLIAHASPETGRLTVHQPAARTEPLLVAAVAQAWDHGAGAHMKASRDLVFEGEIAVPADQTDRLINWWELKSRKAKIWQGPFPLVDIARIRAAWQELERVAPDLAAQSQPLMDEVEASWRHDLVEAVRRWEKVVSPHR